MSFYNIKRNPNDIAFSNFIHSKAGGKCEYCGRVCKLGMETIYQLEASHYFSRSHWAVRYDPENVYALCSACHKRMGGYKNSEDGEYDIWVKQKLGEDGYKRLKIRAYSTGVRDKTLIKLYIKELWKSISVK